MEPEKAVEARQESTKYPSLYRGNPGPGGIYVPGLPKRASF